MPTLPINWINALRRGGGASYPAVLDDGNTVAWFDVAKGITKDGSDFVSVWADQSGLSHDLLQVTGTNQPLWTADGVLFDGVDNIMKTDAFTLIQPEFIYLVLKQITWTANDYIFDGDAGDSGILRQITSSPIIQTAAGGLGGSSGDLALDTLGIVRILFNGATSSLQVNENAKIVNSTGTAAMGGFTLGSRGVAGQYSNIQVKEVIIRKTLDGATDEAAIYAYLESKYSIT